MIWKSGTWCSSWWWSRFTKKQLFAQSRRCRQTQFISVWDNL